MCNINDVLFCIMKVLESMIEHGCDLNARNFQDNTALHIMVARNRLNCVILLLSYGADVNAIGMAGDTPLHVAARVAAPATDNWLPMFEQVSVIPHSLDRCITISIGFHLIE